jgi:hypothetical protein
VERLYEMPVALCSQVNERDNEKWGAPSLRALAGASVAPPAGASYRASPVAVFSLFVFSFSFLRFEQF